MESAYSIKSHKLSKFPTIDNRKSDLEQSCLEASNQSNFEISKILRATDNKNWNSLYNHPKLRSTYFKKDFAFKNQQ
jgi:hypothetical protein